MGSIVKRAAAVALLAAVLVGCGQSPATDANSSTHMPDAGKVCSDHFADVRHSEAATAGAVRSPGPALVDPPPGPLDNYPDDEPIALCLVPNGERFDAVAVVISDGTTYVRWGQNLDDAFYWPV